MSDAAASKAQELCPDVTIGEHRVNHSRTREAIASALRAAREEALEEAEIKVHHLRLAHDGKAEQALALAYDAIRSLKSPGQSATPATGGSESVAESGHQASDQT